MSPTNPSKDSAASWAIEPPGLPRVPAPLPVDPWTDRFPELVHGTTVRARSRSTGGDGDSGSEAPFDLGLFGNEVKASVLDRWEALRRHTEMDSVVHARQLHGAGIRVHHESAVGLHLSPPGDGHLTGVAGILLTVAVADCVPVFLVAPVEAESDASQGGIRAIGLVHAGWRGTASGILERGIVAFQTRFGVAPEALHLHLGPAIGVESYEVGPEVFSALGLRTPEAPSQLDLRGVLEERAREAGVDPACITRSPRDTRVDPLLFSHRGGDRGRQVAFLGIRPRHG